MATGKVNVGGNTSKFNIFTQLTEPVTKEGIWLQTSNKYKKVICDSIFYFENEWDTQTAFPSLPTSFRNGDGVSIGTDIYYFGGMASANSSYKYDTINSTFTSLTTIPGNGFYDGRCVPVDNKIYLFGGTSSYNRLLIYDISLNNFTNGTAIPFKFMRGNIFRLGTDIYLCGTSDTNSNALFKYDTVSDTYTQLLGSPIGLYDSGYAPVGDDLYVFGGSGGSTSSYKYNVLNNTWTKNANLPYSFIYGSCVSIGTNIYLLGHNATAYEKYFYKYDTLNNNYTRLNDMLYGFNMGCAVVVISKIYVLGGQLNQQKIQVYSFIDKQYEENSIILFRNDALKGTYYTQFVTPKVGIEGLFTRLLSGFNNVWLFKDSKLQEYSCYYGDGTQWVKFKN